MAGGTLVHLAQLDRVRDPLGVDVPFARLLERDAVGRAPALARQRIRQTAVIPPPPAAWGNGAVPHIPEMIARAILVLEANLGRDPRYRVTP